MISSRAQIFGCENKNQNKTKKEMKNDPKKEKQSGVKSSDLKNQIEKKISSFRPDMAKVLGEETANSAIKNLVNAFLVEADNNKALMTANANYLDRVPSDAGSLVKMHTNLILAGVLNLPVKAKEAKTDTPKQDAAAQASNP
jgi:hypothetical protein